MLAMDVVDTLRHQQGIVERELGGGARKARMIERLRALYRDQGIEVPENILKEGVAALEQNRFVYKPPEPGFKRTMALLYVSRARWGKLAAGIGAAIILVMGAYFLAYLPYKANQAASARVELSETMPKQMQALYDTIFEETKVQSAVVEAKALLESGKAAASEGRRDDAQKVINQLRDIRDKLRQSYSLRVVNREGVKSGFWTFPKVNQNATNYYIVVEAVGKNGKALNLPIVNEETGQIERVSLWGLRVPKSVYDSIRKDKLDNGIIDRNMVGQKQVGYLDPNYTIPVLGGTVTRW
ncbi:hypothetical protein MNBD_ALPHA12-1905 [hydrothermal vent metagenome]|uniref:Uncharacterized protein n=1 Tax=hydrothermal vent metagenome TaxID=652676 RepID=A0A3B0UQW7_9ZZZZ